MGRILCFIAFFLGAVWEPVVATIITVPDQIQTIQAAVNASEDGDTVLVQPGSYRTIVRLGAHNITLASQFLMTGDTSYISSTIIDATARSTAISIDDGQDSSTVVTGFTIAHANGLSGGGIACLNTSPYIHDNIITQNHANRGGGIYCASGGRPRIYHNVISDNTASLEGGGFHIVGGT
jgi:hypothetical protein